MSTPCGICGKGPAAVFTPTIAVCRPCKRDADRQAIEDNPLPNEPTCPTCGSFFNRLGFCDECAGQTFLPLRYGVAS